VKKSEIRKKILKIRKQEHYRDLSFNFKSILRILKKQKTKEKILGGYYPYNYEVSPMEILYNFEKKNYLISLPKIKKNFKMDFFNWSTKDPLTINKYGIPEPISNKIVHPNIFLVPLVAYDEKLYRIGYGGGYYDRYLKKIKKIKRIITIGLAYSFQKVNNVPKNKNDIKLDFVLTEKNN
tara:strand:- start:61 stop:600 length:540 start_codon:yes stop_codon:yes gene_type:complete